MTRRGSRFSVLGSRFRFGFRFGSGFGAALAVAFCGYSGSVRAAAAQRGLTAAPQILRVYDAIFDARFGDVPATLNDACGPGGPQGAPGSSKSGPAPPEACQVLDALALWWQIQVDPLDTRLDAGFQRRVDAAVAATEAWTAREPERAEAWFYRGGAYGARVQWRVLRGERLAAARDGKRIKDALERALALDPDLHDAWFGIGLYHYYADVAPAAAKVLRWLLLLPGGDRRQGLQEMLRARNSGGLLRSEADYQLHVLYLWYEQQPERANELLLGLQQRHPSNPHFPQLVAQIQDVYLHDLTASLRSWRALADAARSRTVTQPDRALAYARLGMALQLDRLFESDLAIEQLRALVAARPVAPWGALAQAYLQLGLALDRMGDRAEALTAYRSAMAARSEADPLGIAGPARAGLRDGPSPQTAQAYRLSLEGWRALERGNLADATRAIGQSLALRSVDPVTRYRQARLLLAQKDDAAALATLETLARARASVPPTIYASACVDAARLHEQRGARPRAVELYRTAQGVFGADRQTQDEARRALARLAATR